MAIGNRALMAAEGVEVGPEVEAWMADREGRAFTCVLLAGDARVAAVLAITDPLKPEAKAVVAALQVRPERCKRRFWGCMLLADLWRL